MRFLFKVLRIDRCFRDFDMKVKRLGWIEGNKWLIEKLGIKVKMKARLPLKGGVLISCNHPTGLDPYLLSSVLGREDVVVVSDVYQVKKGREIAKHILPIYSHSFLRIIYRPITAWFGFTAMCLSRGLKSKSEARKLNRKAIQGAVEALKKGQVVMMFPSGGEYEFLPEKKGLSKIVEEADKRKIIFKRLGLEIERLSELRLLFHFLTGKKHYQRRPVVVKGETK